MTAEQWKKVKTIYQQAIETAPENRRDLLEKLCGCDALLLREVEEMLRFHNSNDGFMEESIFEVAAKLLMDKETLPIGTQIGNYRIIREIGRGGMGVVYHAERFDGLFQMQVAIKIIKRGMDTDVIVKKFYLERQILAQLEHPNIARFLDAGATQDGLPYFVMEYLEGVPIDKFCQNNQLTLEDKLKLFCKVCSAVSYAHQNLIVHRDLKPSNMLISRNGEPKLLDFGIAKIFDLESTDETEITEIANRLLTPEYASPEQKQGEKITTQSDVYSLGVLLSKLIHFQNKDEKQKKKKSLPKDLQAILQTALRTELELRYSSVEGFSGDIKRFLNKLPVLARKDSLYYRISKFIKRHFVAMMFLSLSLSVFVAMATFSIWQAYQANQARLIAEKRFNDVRKLTNLLLFEYHDQISNLQGTTKIRQKVLQDSLEYLDDLAKNAEQNISLLQELGVAYRKIGDVQGKPYLANVGDTKTALESYKKAEQIFLKLLKLAPQNKSFQIEICVLYCNIGNIYQRDFNMDAAIEFHQQALIKLEELANELPEDDALKKYLAETLIGLGDATAGKSGLLLNKDLISSNELLSKSLDYFQKALQINQELVEKNQTVENLVNVSKALQRIAFRFEDQGLREKNVQKQQELYQMALQYHQQAQNYIQQGSEKKPDNAIVYRDVGDSKMLMADVQTKLGDYQTALDNYNQAKLVFDEVSKKDPENKEAKRDLANLYERLGRFYVAKKDAGKAVKSYKQAVEIMEEVVLKDPIKSDESQLSNLKWWVANASHQVSKDFN